MNDLIDKYNRISAILSCLNVDYRKDNLFDGENPAKSIAQLSEELSIPREQLRQDLMILMASPIFRSCIESVDPNDPDNSDTIFSDELVDLLDRQSEGWDTLPINFYFNDLCSLDGLISGAFSASDENDLDEQPLPVYMSETERELFYHYAPNYKKENWNTLLFKNLPFSQINREICRNRNKALDISAEYEQINRNLDQITIAIHQHGSINFIYRDKLNSIQEMTIRPLRLLESLDKGLHYIVSSPDDKTITFHRLDRIRGSVKSIKKVKKDTPADAQPEPDDVSLETLLQRFDYIWDTDTTYDQEPFDVRIRIDVNTRNILQKIKNETSRRKYAQLTQSETESGVWYYTDRVIGFHSFRRWVFQYGASMTVLEPKELADSICQSALFKLKFYETGKFER